MKNIFFQTKKKSRWKFFKKILCKSKILAKNRKIEKIEKNRKNRKINFTKDFNEKVEKKSIRKKSRKKMKSLRFRQDGVLGSAAQLRLKTVSLGQIRNTSQAEYQFRPPIERRRRPHSWRGGENMKNIEK